MDRTRSRCLRQAVFGPAEDDALPAVTYAAVPGPQYETAAEVAVLRSLGADVVGMSAAAEVRAALGRRPAGRGALGGDQRRRRAAPSSGRWRAEPRRRDRCRRSASTTASWRRAGRLCPGCGPRSRRSSTDGSRAREGRRPHRPQAGGRGSRRRRDRLARGGVRRGPRARLPDGRLADGGVLPGAEPGRDAAPDRGDGRQRADASTCAMSHPWWPTSTRPGVWATR